jgi:AcrR family transcriptional regulator
MVAYIRSPGGDGAPVMTTPTARAPRGPADGSGKITRDAVLAAALEIIDRDGADALSMRRLARALDRDPMILYRHAPGKAALLDGVAETVLAQLQVDSADPDWAGQLRQVARRFRALALAHPHVVPLIVTRPLATPLGLRPLGTLRPLEDILALLTRAGFSGPDALHIYRALFGFLHGHILDELQCVVHRGHDQTMDWSRTSVSREAEPVFHLRKLEKACCWRRNAPRGRIIRGTIRILLRTPAIAPAISAEAAVGPGTFFCSYTAQCRPDATAKGR